MSDGSITLVDGTNVLLERLDRNKIALEKVWARYECYNGNCVLAISGLVHVSNLTYEKQVFARLTRDDWKTYEDIYGSYYGSSQDGKTDIFTFGFTKGDDKPVDIEFALCCIQDGWAAWDNNEWKNYKFHLGENPLSN